MFFLTLIFFGFFIDFGAQFEPKNYQIAWGKLAKFGVLPALVAGICLSASLGGFWDDFGRILGVFWEDFRGILSGF